jgi:2-keto-4-pentenoate hydratase
LINRSSQEQESEEAAVLQVAATLDEAARLHKQVAPAGITDLATAYAVQQTFVERRAARLGSQLAGYKVALTSPEAQAALKADEPASGQLLQADVRPSGAEIDLAAMFTPLIEVEAMFRVVADLPPAASFAQVAASCEVTAGLEFPDGRWQRWFGGDFPVVTRYDVVADDCLAGLIVVGDSWIAADALDLASTAADLLIDGSQISSGPATDVLGNPVNAVVWLSGQLAARGEILRKGIVISSGTYTSPIPARSGVVEARFGQQLGNVTARFFNGR